MNRLKRLMIWLAPLAMTLASCANKPRPTVVKEVPVEVKVPVSAPCVVNRPEAPQPLSAVILPEEWRVLTTDQRENLLASQALNRKAYQEKLEVAVAGCH